MSSGWMRLQIQKSITLLLTVPYFQAQGTLQTLALMSSAGQEDVRGNGVTAHHEH